MFKRYISFSNFTLLVALTLSTIAAWYSIIGLIAIFAGAVIPIIVMGSALELAKIVTTVWLRKYWDIATWKLKIYLVPAVILLALLTSMGIFGFLSKAHMDQGMISGDVQAKLSLYDEKIKTQRDNIALARKALEQMDAQVDQRLARSDSEQAAERAVAIRRQQAGERTKLQKEIGDAQKEIQKLNEERAPVAAENRKVEAEVGPIKYIAALIYGDNADQNMLEAAVRWVIILLVIVFDPLAIALVLAANSSKEWDNKVLDDLNAMSIIPPKDEDIRPFTEEEIEALNNVPEPEEEEKPIEETHPYLFKEPGLRHPPGVEPVGPQVYTPAKVILPAEETTEDEAFKELEANLQRKLNTVMLISKTKEPTVNTETNPEPTIEEQMADTVDTTIPEVIEGVTEEPFKRDDEYVDYNGQHMHISVLKQSHPEMFDVLKDTEVSIKFGTEFPKYALPGDTFIKTDRIPHKKFKFNKQKWIEITGISGSDSYLSSQEYLKYLVEEISAGRFDPEMLTDSEQDAVTQFIKDSKRSI